MERALKGPVSAALASAALFGLGTPLAKLLLKDITPVGLAGILYLGVFAGLGLFSAGRAILGSGKKGHTEEKGARLGGKDLPWLLGAVLCGGVAGPILLMLGLGRTAGFASSLLLNFEGAATAVIAVLLFEENAGRRVWLALGTMTAAGVLLTWNPESGRLDPAGPAMILGAMFCWGLDNNLTRHISDKDPLEIARIKGLAAGIISLSLALSLGMPGPRPLSIAWGLLVGALSYGLSLVLFIRALRDLGAFRTGALFSLGPFLGAVGAFGILGERPGWTAVPAGALMILGVFLIAGEKHGHRHRHERLTHSHPHTHGDLHHLHSHGGDVREPHRHEHRHEDIEHIHGHWPDVHHRHGHGKKLS